DLRLLHFQSGVDQRDLSLSHFAWHAGMNAFLVDDNPVHHRRVGDGTTLLLDDLDVVIIDEIGIVRPLLRDRADGLDGDVGEVLDVDLLEDRHAIVRDDDVSQAVDEHLVHPTRAEGRANRIRDGLRRCDVVELRSLAALAARPFLEYQYLRSCWHHVNLSEYGIRDFAYVGTSI